MFGPMGMQALLPYLLQMMQQGQGGVAASIPPGQTPGPLPPPRPQQLPGPTGPSSPPRQNPWPGVLGGMQEMGQQFDAERMMPRQQTAPMMPPPMQPQGPTSMIDPNMMKLLQMLLSMRR